MIRLHVDGTAIEAPDGATILAAADAAGIYIPRLCSHPDLPPVARTAARPLARVHQGRDVVVENAEGGAVAGDAAGVDAGAPPGAPPAGCGLCLVQVEGEAEPVPACATVAADGMVVATVTDAIRGRRRDALSRILATHPHACLQCAQKVGCAREPCSTNVDVPERCCPLFADCELRRVAEHVGIPDGTPRYRPAGRPVVQDDPLIRREHELCVGCLRCVRICNDVRQVGALGFVRGEDGRLHVGTPAPTLLESGCHFCLGCVEVCPTGALRLAVDEPRRDGERAPRCVVACPAGIDVPRYLREIRRGEFARAEAVVREVAPLPRVLGQVCFHPCEESCLRHELGSEPLAVCGLKRAALEHMGEAVWHETLREAIAARGESGKSVAVIGAGPAGLAAAWFLRLRGHAVTVHEAAPEPGGWLRDGIPPYRLDRAALAADVADIAAAGVELRCGVAVGRDVTLDELRTAHDAVLVAAGARRAKRLPCPGADLPGVESGLGLLQAVAGAVAAGSAAGSAARAGAGSGAALPSLAGERVAVIGGGNVAIDVARTARRLGAAAVDVWCLERRDEMPAHAAEIADAEAEGVVLHPGWGPRQIAAAGAVDETADTGAAGPAGGESSRLDLRLDFQRCTAVLDDRGRFAPRFDGSETCAATADRVLVAIGQEADLDPLGAEVGEALQAGRGAPGEAEGLFAAGEVVLGPASVVEAVAQGRRVAAEIDRFLGGDGDLAVPLLGETELETAVRETGTAAITPATALEGPRFAGLGRLPMPRLRPQEAVAGFGLVERGYDAGQAVIEAGRCLACDLRLALRRNPAPPEPLLALTAENVAAVPATAGAYQLLDETRTVYAIKGVADLRAALTGLLDSPKARWFLHDEDPMFSRLESELIQEYLRKHGRMPPGEGDDDLDDLF